MNLRISGCLCGKLESQICSLGVASSEVLLAEIAAGAVGESEQAQLH